ncbi:MAG: hypothetical protein CM1200mP3_11760 [Chloroflexota bacterium]|nr:MAG: hypothetical protein CM1200mP3_11760 [Chloroflexota bacterium]
MCGAFTGWTKSQTIPRYPTGFYNSEFIYREEDHDDGIKTFLGETGRFNGKDIIDIIVRHPATAKFVAKEIYAFFVSDDPDESAIKILLMFILSQSTLFLMFYSSCLISSFSKNQCLRK